MSRQRFARILYALYAAIHEALMLVTDTFYRTKYRAVSQQLGLPDQVAGTERGFVVIQVDSLAHEHLLAAIERGYAPYLKRMLERGHLLGPYTCGLPSSTPGCQAAIMYGDNYNVPAFRWYDKTSRRTVSCKLLSNAHSLDQEIGIGRRGILEGGSSYTNLISGGAARSLFTMSTFGHGSLLDGIKGLGFFALFALSPVRTARVLVLSLVETLYAFCERVASYWRTEHRVRWEGAFPLVRILAHVFIKEMQTFAVMVDMYRGVPNIYTTYNIYDNMAHHYGPTSRPAWRAVRTVDRQIRQIDRMRRHAHLKYDVYVLSDHGQTPAVPFRQLYGQSFGRYVAGLVRHRGLVEQVEAEPLERSHIGFLADELRSAQRSLSPGAARAVDRLRRYVEHADHQAVPASQPADTAAEVVAVGCSGMAGLYFNEATEHLDLTRIETAYPGLIDKLVEHPGIGLVIGRQGRRVVVLGRQGRLIWDGSVRVVGNDPLAALDAGEWTLPEVLRVAAYPRSADLIIFGSVTNGVGVAFEEQMGIHGALGGAQAHPFLLVPPGSMLVPADVRSSHDLYDCFLSYLPAADAAERKQRELAGLTQS